MRKNNTNEHLHTQHQFHLKPAYAAVLLAFTVQTVEANPLDPTVVRGQASFASSGSSLTVTNAPGTIINWQGFSIGANEITRFNQQSASSAVLNRVISNNPSSILGTLQSNGRVFLINPNGIVFGAGSVVDVAGLVASTLRLSDDDFLAGLSRFTQIPGAANVSNAGNITAQNGGQIFLIAPNVENTGVITAPNGEILLAAGYSVDLVSTSDPELRVSITAPAGDATNVGKLIASSGSLGLFGTVVRNSGTVSADSATLQGGKIVFKASLRVEAGGTISAQGAGGGEIKILSDMQAGTVNVTGALDASAPVSGDGGFIDTSAAHVQVADTARVSTLAANGNNGMWLIDPTDYYVSATDPANGSSWMSNTTLSTSLGSGNVTIQTLATGAGNGDIFVSDAVSWASANSLTLNAIRNIEVNAAISNAGTGNLILRADLNGSSIGTIIFGASGSVALTGGRADLYYNPVSYADAATKSDALTNPYTTKITGPYTAWMLVNDVGIETIGTLGLQAMSTNLTGNYALGKDIDATGTNTWNVSAGFAPVGTLGTYFTGRFDGQGHIINGLFINRSTSFVGLFGATQASTIKNVTLTNANVTGGSDVGGLVGWHQGSLTNSHILSGTVTGTSNFGYAGGLVGINYNNSTIDNCSAGSTVSGINYVGGLVGGSQQSTISNSSASGTVTGTQYYVGGLAGSMEGGSISASNLTNGTATGNVVGGSYVGGLVGWSGYRSNITNGIASGTVSGNNDVGGLVGFNAYNIASSHATGSVTGLSNVGGLVGNNGWDNSPAWASSYGAVSNSYANTGTVTGTSNVGGLVGYNYFGTINISYADGAVSGNSNVGGLVGYNDRGSISIAYSTGTVTGNGVGSTSLGGLVGYNDGTITNSYVTSVSVTGVNNIGGLVGNNAIFAGYANSITGSYVSGGSVTGTGANVGGLVGNNTGTLTNSHYSITDVTINGANIVTLGGLYNDNTANLQGIGQYNDWLLDKALNIADYTSLTNTGINSYTLGTTNGMKDLLGFADNPLYTFTLTGNINLTGMAGFYVPILASSFDGAVFTVSNLSLNVSTSNLGFFGKVSGTSTVSNMVLENASVIGGGGNNVGALAGSNFGTINNSSVRTSIGGSATVSGADSVGGLVGNNAGSITSGSVDGTVGTLTVTGVNSVGGLAGSNSSSINTSFAKGATVAGVNNIGGLVGNNAYLGSISNSYVASGAVSATVHNVGGLIGFESGGMRNNSYFNIDAVTTNGGNNVTAGGLYATQYNDWFAGGALTPLVIGSYASLALQVDGSYGISNMQGMKDMLGFADDPAAYNFSLTATNINLDPGYYVPKLAGSFNGKTFTLSNLSLTLPNDDMGLFGVTSMTSVVSNLNLVNAGVNGYGNVGGLVASNFGNIDNVTVGVGTNGISAVTGKVGGLVGQNYGGSFTTSGAPTSGIISNSFVTGGTVTGSSGDVGGLVGYNNQGNISASHVDNTAVSGTSNVGGLVGYNLNTTCTWCSVYPRGMITNSYVTNGTVTSTGGGLDTAIGGLVGLNLGGDISGSHVLNSTVSGGSASWVGGLVGRNDGGVRSVYQGTATGWVKVYYGTIINSYVSGGTVSSNGNDVGGLVGHNHAAPIDLSHVDTVNVTGVTNVGGLVGYDSGEGYGGGLGIISSSHALNTQVTGESRIGGLVGMVAAPTIFASSDNFDAVMNSYVMGGTVISNAATASATAIGGLVGYNSYGNISNSYVTNGTVVNGGLASDVGGLVGHNIGSGPAANRHGLILKSYVNGGTVSGNRNIGGLVGNNAKFGLFDWGFINSSYVSGATVSGVDSLGGLVGNNGGAIDNSYVVGGSVTSPTSGSSVAGLVGSNSGTISNTYVSGGTISSSFTYEGGLVGYNTGSISNSFWDTQTTAGPAPLDAIWFDMGTATNVLGRTTTQMMTQTTFTDAGWDFTNTWWMSEGNTRPFLRSEWSTNITNAHQLQLMSMNLGASYTLGANIDMADTSSASGMWSSAGFVPVGVDPYSGPSFTGQFDGLGHTISNLFINRPATNYAGLFGYLGTGAVVSNVGMVGGSVTGYWNVGGLVGWNNGGSINGSYVDGMAVNGKWVVGGLVGRNEGSISGNYANNVIITGSTNVGGLVGENNYGSISNSYVSGGTVSGSQEVGGLVGGSYYGSISNSYVSSGAVNGTREVGGLVGVSGSGSSISNSHVISGSVTGTSEVGGLAGINNGTISNSYVSSGAVNGSYSVGGLVGWNTGSGSISGSYVDTGTVVSGGNYVGGLVGWNSGGSISNSYVSSASVSGSLDVGGLVGTDNGTVINSHFNVDGVKVGATQALAINQVTLGGLYSSQFTDWFNSGLLPLNIANYSASLVLGVGNNYTIGTLQGMKDLLGFADNPLYTFSLSASINLATLPGYYVPTLATNFDGAGFTISNLSINQPFNGDLGLFGHIALGSTVSNVALVDVTVTGNNNVGALAGWNEGIISGISNSYVSSGSVSGSSSVGGLVGNNYGSINISYSSGVTVSGNNSVGGLAGQNSGTISNTYSSGGTVSGASSFGGLVGANWNRINTSYSSNAVVAGGNNGGGLIGWDEMGYINNSYWDTQTSGRATSSGTETGLTSAEMMTMSSFAGWDIANTGGAGKIWRIYAGSTTPLLTSFLTPLTLTGAPDVSVTYNGAAQNGGAFTLITNVLGAAATGTNAGFYNGYYSTQQGYDITGGNLTITPATLTYTATAANRLYGGTDPAFGGSVTGFVNGELLANVTTGTETFTTTALSTSNVGSYAITGSGLSANNGNYVFVQAAGNSSAFIVNPYAVSMTGSRAYDGTANVAAGIFTLGPLVGTETLTLGGSGTLASKNVVTNGAVTTAGVTLGDGTGLASNYTFTGGTQTATITPATLTLSAVTDTKTYDGTTNSSGIVGIIGLFSPDGVTGATQSFASANVLGANLSTLNVNGGYTVNDGNGGANYSVVTNSATGTINPAALTLLSVTANDASKPYGSTLTFAGTEFVSAGLQGSDVISGVTLTSLGAVNTANAGTYAITPGNAVFSVGSASNYSFTYVDGVLTVMPLAVTIAADASTKVYGDADALTFTATSLMSWDSNATAFTGALSHTGGENVGTYAINAGTLASTNYTFTGITTNNLIITPAPLTVTANDANKILNTSDPLLTYMVAGLKFSDTEAATLSGELSRVAGETVGIYPINQWTLGLISANYTMTFVPGRFTILVPTVINEIVNTSLMFGPDTGSPQSTSSDEEDRAAEEVVLVADTTTAEGTAAVPLPVCN